MTLEGEVLLETVLNGMLGPVKVGIDELFDVGEVALAVDVASVNEDIVFNSAELSVRVRIEVVPLSVLVERVSSGVELVTTEVAVTASFTAANPSVIAMQSPG